MRALAAILTAIAITAVLVVFLLESRTPSPGPLHPVHAREPALDACAACHPRSGGMDEACLACHEEIGARRAAGRGIHGDARPCATCHGEHFGAAAALLSPASFERAGIADLARFWTALGARVDVMDPEHHDLVLAVTSHVPHLIAYTMVGVADHLARVTEQEVINYSAAGFRDFTRIAASDPTMWRDVFLNNKDAVLDMLGRFTEDLTMLQRAIRFGDGDTLHQLFTKARAIRRGVIEAGQDTAAPDFGRAVVRGAAAADSKKT